MYVEAEWAPFGIDEAQYRRYAAHVENTSSRFATSREDEEDAAGAMWLRLLTLCSPETPYPPDFPDDPIKREQYCKKAMWNAAYRCVYRHLPDGPTLISGDVDDERCTLTFTDLDTDADQGLGRDQHRSG